jgi:hypothetical protein
MQSLVVKLAHVWQLVMSACIWTSLIFPLYASGAGEPRSSYGLNF